MISRPLTWRTSSYSGNTGGNCVEVASDGIRVYIRDSKYRRDPANDPVSEPIIAVTPAQWKHLVTVAVTGSSAVTEPAIEIGDTGWVELRTNSGVMLRFTRQEWVAFVAGARDGEFDREALAA
ncbi:DUF397 domain-containing protein [Nocardia puris]|uniref:DUF397 domain-containing protein n=1 Tax=Nocardia TaxID=1817 RepID=UPI00056BFFE4|nr:MULTISPECIES: DUF397 domain-containing protein [Nocardia]MBF6137230.1 DUF397 domain-containing protein [Nocardia otitidiscaviarum]MBF6181834.1 DUF397 domain-containing protein [Nocardia otitidiscaviarum]MBF6461727.1 DUF397 domain-containing protein [Nocardia puris]MBF6488127.1 DUF397 domain-containing protein [Nocardia otitidiscaviarum]